MIYNTKILRKFLDVDIYRFVEVKDNIEILNLGSTAAKYDYTFEKTGKNVLNAAMSPQSLSYDFRILKYLADKINKDCIVNCNISPCSLLVDEYSDWNSHVRYCYFLPKEDIYIYTWKVRLKAMLKPIYGLFKKKSSDNRKAVNIDEHLLARTEGWKTEFSVDSLLDVLDNDELLERVHINRELLGEMIVYCNEHDLRLVFTLLPVSSKLKLHIPDKFYDECITNTFTKLNNNHYRLIDFYHDAEWCQDDRYLECDSLNDFYSICFTNNWFERVGIR